MTAKVRQILAELRRRYEELYGDRLVRLVLFGSQARGDAEDDSDIDVLVVLRGKVVHSEESARTGAIAAELSLDNDVVITCLFMSAARFGAELSPLLMNIRAEGVVL